MIEPEENDSIECHLQQLGLGTLTCRAAKQTGDNATNEVSPIVCFNCDCGKVFREIGCDAVSPKIRIWPYDRFRIESLFCKIRKRETSLDNCKTCQLVSAETTRQLVTSARGLFQSQGFYSAYQDIEKAREAFRDGNFENSITRSISCVESVIKVIYEKLNVSLPAQKQLTDLWKSAREILKFDEIDSNQLTTKLLNTLSGLISQFGALRNSLSDAHGRGNSQQQVSELISELTINLSATLATILIRQYNQISGNEA